MQQTNTAFVGRITNSPKARNAAFRVKLTIRDDTLTIAGTDDEEWTWNMADVTITRIAVDRFSLELTDERLYFLPVDTRRFVTDVLQRFSDTPVEPHRGWLRRRIEEAQAAGGVATGYELEEIADDSGPGGRRRGHIHDWDEGSAAGVLTRRCTKCSHVSIDATGLRSTLDQQLANA